MKTQKMPVISIIIATYGRANQLRKHQKADTTYYPERGISGFFGFVFKRIYNLSIDLRLDLLLH